MDGIQNSSSRGGRGGRGGGRGGGRAGAAASRVTGSYATRVEARSVLLATLVERGRGRALCSNRVALVRGSCEGGGNGTYSFSLCQACCRERFVTMKERCAVTEHKPQPDLNEAPL